MQNSTEILDQTAIRRALTRISFEIVEKNRGSNDLVLAGIRTRGVPMAARLADKIGEVEGVRPPVLEIDTRPYRDDLPSTARAEIAAGENAGVEGKTVVLVDDVLYTGRSVRAAMDAVSRMGRAGRIQLAVLIDRGHRELPIRPDFIGKNVPTSLSERVQVRLTETDGEDSVRIIKLAE